MSELLIIPVSCFNDNYAYLVALPGSRSAVVVDASEYQPVAAALSDRGWQLSAILTTHHHFDHVGGNAEFAKANPDLAIYGHVSDLKKGRINGQTHGLEHGQGFEVAGIGFEALHIPGHTLGAVAYLTSKPELSGSSALFTGDTLFVAGCGRVFEGDAAMMNRSINGTLAALPGESQVFCGHEYTVNNLRFAASVEPQNEAVQRKLVWAQNERLAGRPTVPSTLSDELATNPFMRVSEPGFAAHGSDPNQVFASIRSAKDAF